MAVSVLGLEQAWKGRVSGAPAIPTYAAIDVGTNNCRLLVARPTTGGFRVIDAFSRVVRLGEGLSATGVLSEGAMARTLDALSVCADKMQRHDVSVVRAVATEACRRAENCADFLERARRTTGIALEIISTTEEARLALDGCAPLLASYPPFALIFDIGGGSTELNWLKTARSGAPIPLGSMSLPWGVVTLSERHGSGRLGPAQYEAMVSEVAAELRPFDARYRIAAEVGRGLVQMLGTSGTVTTLAGVHLGLPRYRRALVDGCMLDFDAIAAVSRHLVALDCAQRSRLSCIGPERADLVVAGCAVLEAICRTWPVGRVRVADRGLREGILFRLIGGHSSARSGSVPS